MHYGGEASKYDSAAILILYAEHDDRFPNALESQLVDDDEPHRRSCKILDAVENAIPSIPRLYETATRITVKTIDGEPRFTFSEDKGGLLACPPIPPSLIVAPSVQITELTRLGGTRLGVNTDRVGWQGRQYAFKRMAENDQLMLSELEILTHPPSQHLQMLSAVVIDSRNHLRGFLAPFMPYGSVEEVFVNRTHPSPQVLSTQGTAVFPHPPDWAMKLKWACQISQAIVDLHAAQPSPIVLGNLNPRNILITRSADALVIGLSGTGSATRYPVRWAAPERNGAAYTVGPPLDVAGLGMVLWALSEEKFDGFLDESGARPSRNERWRASSTPAWYRNLVDSCLDVNPAQRPPAENVLAQLERRGQK